MEAKAIAKSLRVSPIKTRITIDLIRGKKVSEAQTILSNINKKSARLIKKVLDSAVANAVNNNGADAATLYVKEARVDAGPVMKRHLFDSRSHIGHKDRRTSHIVITVATKWYAGKKDFAKTLKQDVLIREYFEKNMKNAGIAKVEIERNAKRCEVTVHTSKPGVMIGKGGEEIEKLKTTLSNITGEKIQISIVDIKKAELNAQLVADDIARQISNRISFRMAQKRAIRNAMKAGAKGIKTSVSGRLGGADMARTEGYVEGNVPLHTLRADIDYAHKEADTTYGKIGVKVWIYKGEILSKSNNDAPKKAPKKAKTEGGK